MSRKRIPHEVDNAEIEKNAQNTEIMTFAKTLNSLLIEKEIHQEDMARALGISTGSISSYRNGKKEPRLTMILKIANFLGVDCHYLMTGVQASNYVCSNELGLSGKAINAIKENKASGGWGFDVLNALLENPYFFKFLLEIRRLAAAKYELKVAEAKNDSEVCRLATEEDRVMVTETGLEVVVTGYEKTVQNLTKERIVQEYWTVEKFKELQNSTIDNLISHPEFQKFADMTIRAKEKAKKRAKGEAENHGEH